MVCLGLEVAMRPQKTRRSEKGAAASVAGPYRTFTYHRPCCSVVRLTGHSLQRQNLETAELTVCGTLLAFAARAPMTAFGLQPLLAHTVIVPEIETVATHPYNYPQYAYTRWGIRAEIRALCVILIYPGGRFLLASPDLVSFNSL